MMTTESGDASDPRVEAQEVPIMNNDTPGATVLSDSVKTMLQRRMVMNAAAESDSDYEIVDETIQTSPMKDQSHQTRSTHTQTSFIESFQ